MSDAEEKEDFTLDEEETEEELESSEKSQNEEYMMWKRNVYPLRLWKANITLPPGFQKHPFTVSGVIPFPTSSVGSDSTKDNDTIMPGGSNAILIHKIIDKDDKKKTDSDTASVSGNADKEPNILRWRECPPILSSSDESAVNPNSDNVCPMSAEKKRLFGKRKVDEIETITSTKRIRISSVSHDDYSSISSESSEDNIRVEQSRQTTRKRKAREMTEVVASKLRHLTLNPDTIDPSTENREEILSVFSENKSEKSTPKKLLKRKRCPDKSQQASTSSHIRSDRERSPANFFRPISKDDSTDDSSD